jgi:hypothetical protein
MEELAEAAGRLAVLLGELAPRMEAVSARILVEGSNQRRARWLRCTGCPECTEPLPVLTGDLP